MVVGNPIILGGGSGGGDAYAAISVIYIAGSICTCSQAGQDTLTAEDTSGTWLFTVPVGGQWTITATDGANIKSTIVAITEYGQIEQVELLNDRYIFNNGSFKEITGFDVIRGTQEINNDVLVLNSTINQYTIATAKQKIALNPGDILTVELIGGYSYATASVPTAIGFSTSIPTQNASSGAVTGLAHRYNISTAMSVLAEQTIEVTVPNTLTGGSYYLSFIYASTSGRAGYLDIKTIKITKGA